MGVNIAKLAQIEVVRDMKKENHDQIAYFKVWLESRRCSETSLEKIFLQIFE
jgi:hypothetical protein